MNNYSPENQQVGNYLFLLWQFEGTPFHPDAGRFWEVCDKYKVTKFYTAPTAIRALMKFGEEIVNKWVEKIVLCNVENAEYIP